MMNAIKPVLALMLAAAIFLMGNGLQTTLVPLAAGMNGLADTTVGLIVALFCGVCRGVFVRVAAVGAGGAHSRLCGDDRDCRCGRCALRADPQ